MINKTFHIKLLNVRKNVHELGKHVKHYNPDLGIKTVILIYFKMISKQEDKYAVVTRVVKNSENTQITEHFSKG